MKKLFIFVAILAVLAGCSQNETVKVAETNYISFTNAFIDNATRADNTITTDLLAGFDVWAHNSSTAIMRKVTVTKQLGTWTYDEKKEWEEGELYYFHAFAPVGVIASLNPYPAATGDRGLPIITFTNSGNKDFIYATEDREQPLKIDAPLNTSPVVLTFKHLLSRVKFTFENKVPENITLEVLNVKITDAGQIAKIDLNKDFTAWAWEAPTSTVPFLFGNTPLIVKDKSAEAENVLFMLPEASREYTITFDIRYEGNVVNKEVKITHEFKMGRSYNFKAVINEVAPFVPTIEFEVNEVEEWPTDDNVTIG